MSDRVNVPMGTTRAGITNFEHWDLVPIKRMVENSRPERLHEVAQHWMSVKKELDAASEELKAATDHITAHWEGQAAQGFAQRSAVLQQSITNTGAHAENTSHALTYAGSSLQVAKTQMASIHVPSEWEKAKDKVGDLGNRDDSRFRADIAAGMDRDTAVSKNSGSLSLLEERHQQAIAVMERLAPQYKSASAAMTPPDSGTRNNYRPFPSEPEKKIKSPSDVGPAPKSPNKTGGTTDTGNQPGGNRQPYQDPRSGGGGGQTGNDGIGTHPTHGGMPVGDAKPPMAKLPNGMDPIVHTGIDSHGGGGTAPTGEVPTGLGLGTGGGGGGGGGGGSSLGGGVGSGNGYGGGTAYGGGTFGTGRGGSGSAGGRAGAGGTGGMPGMGGAGAGRAGAGSRGSGLARRAGGAVGANGKRTGGSFTEGGTGLGRNRGAGAANGRGGGAMPGAGAAGQRKKDKKGGSRPDYLVEDEDTWTGGGGPVNPPVVE